MTNRSALAMRVGIRVAVLFAALCAIGICVLVFNSVRSGGMPGSGAQLSAGSMLLNDIRNVFGSSATISAADLVDGTLPDIPTTPNPRGIIVCEPVPSQSFTEADREFSDGCGEWLDFVMAGQPELGATPQWRARDRAEFELGRSDLRLTLRDAVALNSMTGANIVAVGAVDGSPSAMSLTYTLYNLPSEAEIGAPITISGAEEQIVANLPSVAKGMSTMLGVTAPAALYDKVGLSPSDLSLCVRVRWTYDNVVKSDQTALIAAADRSPFVAVLALSRVPSAQLAAHRRFVYVDLYGRGASQPDVLNEITWSAGMASPKFRAMAASSIARWPDNHQYRTLQTWLDTLQGNSPDEVADAKWVAATAPNDPDAWDALVHAYRTKGIRGSVDENWIGCAEHAVRLDPNDGHAWDKVAEASMYSAGLWEFYAATDKAIKLGTPEDNVDAYSNVLQAIRPGMRSADPARTERYVAAIIGDPAMSPDSMLDIVQEIQNDSGIKSTCDEISEGALARCRTLIAGKPNTANLYADMGEANANLLRFAIATGQYRTALVLDPTNPIRYFDLGRVYKESEDFKDAVPQFQRAVKICPQYPDAYAYMGQALFQEHMYTQAESAFETSIAQYPDDYEANYGLAETYYQQKLYAKSAVVLEHWVDRWPHDVPPWVLIICDLGDAGDYSGAIAEGNSGWNYAGGSPRFNDDLADAYTHMRQPAKALELCRQSFDILPDDQLAHENMAEAYISEGDRQDAQREWDEVVASRDPEQLSTAVGYLKKYHMT
jgi:tetratricopeptide (TPR) repeat protein